MKMKKILIMIMVNILPLKNLISQQQKILLLRRRAQANLASKSDIANFVKKTDFDDKLKNLNKKVTSNKTKNLLVENGFKKLESFDSSLFIGQNYKGSCLKQDKTSFIPKIVVTLHIAYELNIWSQDKNAEFTLKDCFFWSCQDN